MILHLPKLVLMFMVASIAFVVPAASQTFPKKPDPTQLACGQTILIDDRTCPTKEILQVTGSCYNSGLSAPDGTRLKGVQYNCIKRK